MLLNWNSLRPWQNSVNLAFEELCCQLAEYESCPPGSRFIRKGTPDGGVECFWIDPSGSESAWQAKFLFAPFSSGKWAQLDKSVENALKNHPKLSRYTICLPFDRPDSKGGGNKTFLTRWNLRVKKWQAEALRRRMRVQFEFWGAHEIGSRLALEQHAGRYRFWFDREFLSDAWFKNHIAEVIENAGDRYTPVLNVELPIGRVFDGLGRTAGFFLTLDSHRKRIKQALRAVSLERLRKLEMSDPKLLEESILSLLDELARFRSKNFERLPIEGAGRSQYELVVRYREELRGKEAALTEAQALESEVTNLAAQEFDKLAKETKRELNALAGALYELSNLAETPEAQCVNKSALLVVGDAGSGKTHLFCDVARARTDAQLPTVVLLGQQFSRGEPWTQILDLLHLDCKLEEFLGALDASSQANQAKGLIFIDALNEGEGEYVWPNHLAGILSRLSEYPRLGIAFSVRRSYEEIVVPSRLVANGRLVRSQHFGFLEREYEATTRFFAHFGIEPTTPSLFPEFKNPQFLLMFCKGLKNKRISRVPPGIQGITSIFDFYLDSVNDKLALSTNLDFDRESHLVQRATESFVKQLADDATRWLPRERAATVVDAYLPGRSFQRSLFRHLITEGILAEDVFRRDDGANTTRGVRCAYERFADHKTAKILLDRCLVEQKATEPNIDVEPIAKLLADENACWRHQGLVEALCIQVPERSNKELPDLLPHTLEFRSVRKSFVESLIWRDPQAVSDATYRYLHDQALRYEETFNSFLDAVLILAPIPKHPFNGAFLHRYLSKFTLAERDSWWSKYLHQRFGNESSVNRLLDWVWSPLQKNDLEHESATLFAIVLSWFFTSSNRYLRDRATKTLAKLIGSRSAVLLDLLRVFRDVDDPYVLERLLAVSYGVASKISDVGELCELAEFVFEWIFASGDPYTHILVRDYARGVIEAAVVAGAPLKFSLKRARPPYVSKWPKKVPTERALKTKYGWHKEGMPEGEWARVSIFDSVMGFGDFARYVIGTNSGFFAWSGAKRGERATKSREQRYREFIANLDKPKRKLWDQLSAARFSVLTVNLGLAMKGKVVGSADEPKRRELELKVADERFQLRLSATERRAYRRYVLSYLNDRQARREPKPFDLKVAQRWILARVFELGWSVKKFGEFDREINRWSWNRDARKAERIGKKYQWIAYHEFLGMVSDHFKFTGHFGDTNEYEGPWQLFVRDIDPTCALSTIRGGELTDISWWSPVTYHWKNNQSHKDWLRDEKDLPPVDQLIQITNPTDKSESLVLESNCQWEDSIPPDEERFENKRRHLWYQLRSFVVEKKNSVAVYKWLSTQHFWGRWMPEPPDYHSLFLGELYWAQGASKVSSICDPTAEGSDSRVRQLPACLIGTVGYYSAQQDSFDCSVEENFRLHVPSKWLVEKMGLRWNANEGRFYDSRGVLIAFDPAITNKGPNALVFRKDDFLRFLDESGYCVIWTLLGGKQIIYGNSREWIGELQISGTFMLNNKGLEGKLRPVFRDR